jgi:hypothetical protein
LVAPDRAMDHIGPLGIGVEHELLLGLARTCQDDWTVNRLSTLLDQTVDWPHLLQLTDHHRVIPLLYQSLQRAFPGLAPADVMQALQQQYMNIAQRNLLLTGAMKKLIDFLDQQGVCAIPYKGPTMALLVYRNLCLRQFGDIDILVDPGDYGPTRELLLAKGYRLHNDWGWECSLVDDSRGICVDLHRRLTPEVFPVRLDFASLLKRLEPLTIAGRDINVLSAEDMLLVLCVQLANDGWGEKAVRLSKICDIAELLRTHPRMNWERVFNEAEKLGCRRMIALGLIVSHQLLGAPAPEAVMSRARTDRQSHILARYIYHDLFQDADDQADALLSREGFHFRLRERWRDKLYPYYQAVRLRLPPNERDQAVLALPGSLNFLYYLIRPLRVARDYARLLFEKMRKVR